MPETIIGPLSAANTLSAPLTAFDAVAITVIIVSGLMALARGFMRELASLFAFVAAVAAAFLARAYFREPLDNVLPETLPAWTPDAILVLGTFIIVYVVLAWIGGRLSRHIQGAEGVGVINRLAGLLFGAARGVVAVIAFVLVVNLALPEERVPPWIAEGRLYPYFADWAQQVRDFAPRLADQAADLVPEGDTGGE